LPQPYYYYQQQQQYQHELQQFQQQQMQQQQQPQPPVIAPLLEQIATQPQNELTLDEILTQFAKSQDISSTE
jgi:hypothetical protein